MSVDLCGEYNDFLCSDGCNSRFDGTDQDLPINYFIVPAANWI